jgi:hypothetical protein
VLSVGNHTIDKAFVYGLVYDRGGVLMLPTGIRRYALPEPWEFRNKRVMDFQLSEVSGFTLSTPRGSMSWRQTPEIEWTTIKNGAVVNGRKADVEGVLRRLRGLRATSFVTPDDAARLRLFEPAAGSVTITKTGDEPAVTIVAGKKHMEGACARVSGEDRIVVTDAALLDIFEKSLYDLRDRRLLRFDKADVTKIEIEAPGFRLTMVRPGRDWTFPNPSMGVIDQESAARVLSGLARLEFERAVDENPDQASRAKYFTDPQVRITIFNESGFEIDDLVCAGGARGSGVYYASSRSSELISAIEAGKIDDLVERVKSLRQ